MKNVDCSVVISIGAEAARRTDKRRLVLAASAVHDSAARTRLRGKLRVYLYETICFIKQHCLDLVPAHVENGAVESALLGDVPAGFLHGSGRGFGHVLGAQALNNDRSKLSANFRCCDVRPMFTDTSLLGPYSCNALVSYSATPGTSLTAAGNALCLSGAPIKKCELLGQRIGSAI